MSLSQSLPLALAALGLEALISYPAPLYRAVGHPVTWMGAWLTKLEFWLNRPGSSFAARRALGALTLLLYLAPVALVSAAATELLGRCGTLGFAVLSLLAASLPAQRSLDAHVRAVADGLDSNLEEGRRAVALIVGRNPHVLDEAGVARAAIESLAENFSDGVVAPILWIALGGLTGGALYKAINTADSMIGHRDARYAAFGWAAARLDDLVNLPASRLAALWLVLAAAMTPAASAREALRAVRRDAAKHRSPNAGWPEAAMAGALGLRLAGPRVYGQDAGRGRVHGRGAARRERGRRQAGGQALPARLRHRGSGSRGPRGPFLSLSPLEPSASWRPRPVQAQCDPRLASRRPPCSFSIPEQAKTGRIARFCPRSLDRCAGRFADLVGTDPSAAALIGASGRRNDRPPAWHGVP